MISTKSLSQSLCTKLLLLIEIFGYLTSKDKSSRDKKAQNTRSGCIFLISFEYTHNITYNLVFLNPVFLIFRGFCLLFSLYLYHFWNVSLQTGSDNQIFPRHICKTLLSSSQYKLTLHSEGFSGACLSIRKYGTIEALQDRVHQATECLIVQVQLFGTGWQRYACIKIYIQQCMSTWLEFTQNNGLHDSCSILDSVKHYLLLTNYLAQNFGD